jgi:hypothetical protein
LDKRGKDKAYFSHLDDYGVYPVIWRHMTRISYLSVAPNTLVGQTGVISCAINYGKIREKYVLTGSGKAVAGVDGNKDIAFFEGGHME